MIAGVLRDWFGWFGWDNGAVLTNLVATAIGFVLVLTVPVWRIFTKLNKIHGHAEAAHAKAAHEHVLANVPVKARRRT